MIKKKDDKKHTNVREKVDLDEQVGEQIRAYRNARNIGNLQFMQNTISGLFVILRPWMSKDKIKEYEDIKYRPKIITDFYGPKDWEMDLEYSGITRKRKRALNGQVVAANRRLFYITCDKKMGVLMDAFKALGLGFQEEETAVISWDKKKATFTER
jgi:hypothetical protein